MFIQMQCKMLEKAASTESMFRSKAPRRNYSGEEEVNTHAFM